MWRSFVLMVCVLAASVFGLEASADHCAARGASIAPTSAAQIAIPTDSHAAADCPHMAAARAAAAQDEPEAPADGLAQPGCHCAAPLASAMIPPPPAASVPGPAPAIWGQRLAAPAIVALHEPETPPPRA